MTFAGFRSRPRQRARTPITCLALLAVAVAAQPLIAQRSGGGPGSPGSARLERSGLRIGSNLPDVTAYDETGRDLPIGQLKGDYTVLVFGCLT